MFTILTICFVVQIYTFFLTWPKKSFFSSVKGGHKFTEWRLEAFFGMYVVKVPLGGGKLSGNAFLHSLPHADGIVDGHDFLHLLFFIHVVLGGE